MRADYSNEHSLFVTDSFTRASNVQRLLEARRGAALDRRPAAITSLVVGGRTVDRRRAGELSREKNICKMDACATNQRARPPGAPYPQHRSAERLYSRPIV